MIVSLETVISSTLMAAVMPNQLEGLIKASSSTAILYLEKEMSNLQVENPQDRDQVVDALIGVCSRAAEQFAEVMVTGDYPMVYGRLEWISITEYRLMIDLKEGYIRPSMSLH